MQSSPGRSQRGHSRDDVPMTDQTDDDPYEVLYFPYAVVKVGAKSICTENMFTHNNVLTLKKSNIWYT